MNTRTDTGNPVFANPFTRETGALMASYLEACERVLKSGWFILGHEVEAFEKEFASWIGKGEVVGCASGLDALLLTLKALGVGQGDEVITTPLSAAATALAISHLGATPVFADVDSVTLSLDPKEVGKKITQRTRAILPVHLYGYPAPMAALRELCAGRNIALVEDCAQASGTRAEGAMVGTGGVAGCFSFYPTKNLGAFGDGGAIYTENPDLAATLRKLRNYGQSARYEHDLEGFNSRLDELQAAFLRVKLSHLDAWNLRRQKIASIYDQALANAHVWKLPRPSEGSSNVYHLYPVQVEQRDLILTKMKNASIEGLIHYPKLIPEQACYSARYAGNPKDHWPVAYAASRKLMSLPINPYVTDEECRRVIEFFVRHSEL